jgi:hypothetical protein
MVIARLVKKLQVKKMIDAKANFNIARLVKELQVK